MPTSSLVSTHSINADTGTTGHFISLPDSAVLLDIQPVDSGISVSLPNGQVITSTHTATLNLPSLPLSARSAQHIRYHCPRYQHIRFNANSSVVPRQPKVAVVVAVVLEVVVILVVVGAVVVVVVVVVVVSLIKIFNKKSHKKDKWQATGLT